MTLPPPGRQSRGQYHPVRFGLNRPLTVSMLLNPFCGIVDQAAAPDRVRWIRACVFGQGGAAHVTDGEYAVRHAWNSGRPLDANAPCSESRRILREGASYER
jgi:hypothetical protein